VSCNQVADPRLSREPARHVVGLATLASAAFVYVTAETLPVGLLPQLSVGLHVSDGAVGLLVTAYAGVAGLAALPVTARMGARPRRQVVTGAVALLAVSLFVMAVAPDYAVLLAARLVCALAHGVFWSVLAPVAARLAPPGNAGRATATVFAGNSLALVLGVPLATALGQLTGWRIAMVVIGGAAVISAVGLRMTMPPLPPEGAAGDAPEGARGDAPEDAAADARPSSMAPALRSGPLAVLCAVTTLLVIGHFTAYTYIAALVRRDAGLAGLALSAVLFAYGVAGIGGIALTGWLTDRRPRQAAAACALSLTAALLGLTVLAPGSPVATVVAVILWGAAFTALPVCLQAGVLRIAPRFADTASALYVVAFQIGIGGGSLGGALLVDSGLLGDLPAIGAVLAAAGTIMLLTARRAFPPAGGAFPPAGGARPAAGARPLR
jgi:predicted MFS family arabinose efflux permease